MRTHFVHLILTQGQFGDAQLVDVWVAGDDLIHPSPSTRGNDYTQYQSLTRQKLDNKAPTKLARGVSKGAADSCFMDKLRPSWTIIFRKGILFVVYICK